MAEMYGKIEGCLLGRGGSMHYLTFQKNSMAAMLSSADLPLVSEWL
jgi:TPP-dependent pyruvate/acetoin dehydrogenase alpha subunit